MIDFICPSCGNRSEVEEGRAGSETNCVQCGAVGMVPVDLACEDLPTSAQEKTITLEELKALRKKS